MKIKKYIAKTLNEGKKHIMLELGDDAIILSSKASIKPDTGEQVYEIVAAIDNVQKKKIEKEEAQADAGKATPNPLPSAFDFLSKTPQFEKKVNNDLAGEIKELRHLVENLSNNVKYKHTASLNSVFGSIYKALLDSEISEPFALEIIGQLSKNNPKVDLGNAITDARKYLVKHLNVLSPIQNAEKRQIFSFLGGSGSGKTSALIKIAVICKLLYKADILIISADTYKVGGAEQLQTISSIASIPFKSVYSPEELEEVLGNEKKRDMIFIDTTGKSHRDTQHRAELESYFKVANLDKLYLVESAKCNRKTFNNILKSYSSFNIAGLIVTKLDEADSVGGIVDSLRTYNIPLAYISTGQKIPEDIEPVEKAKLSRMILADDIEIIGEDD